MSKIFVIGFNKCGTTSLHSFLKSGGLRAVHWRTHGQKRHIAEVMFTNLSLRTPILQGLTHFDVFSDMMFLSGAIHLEANILFRDMHSEYPQARFILNTRNKDNWIASRLRHLRGGFLRDSMSCYGLDKDGVVSIWSDQWDRHHQEVRTYFRHHPEIFQEFNIERDDISMLCDFLRDMTELEPAAWKVLNASIV
jgi:hypothetical protein